MLNNNNNKWRWWMWMAQPIDVLTAHLVDLVWWSAATWRWVCIRRMIPMNSHSGCGYEYSIINNVVVVRSHRLHAVHEMRPIATDVACSVVCVSVCVLVTRVCCAKTAEPIDMSFGRLTLVGPRNHALGGVKTSTARSILGVVGSLCCGVRSKMDDSFLNNGMTV